MLCAFAAATLHAECTIQLSEQGTVRIQSGDQRTLTWNTVPGASSYYVEKIFEGLGEPAGPDFTFGGPYTESHNYEGRAMTSFIVSHAVLYKVRVRYVVSALNRENASFQPCKADVLYVVEPDERLVSIASRRIVPIAGKSLGMNGASYSTSLILAGRSLGFNLGQPKPFEGRIYFRPLGAPESTNDPSIAYSLNDDQTVVYDDIMQTLGATGIGSIEIVPRIGWPTPLADAIIENRSADGKRYGARVPAVWARERLATTDSMTVGIRNNTDTRIAIGVRTLGSGGNVHFQRLSANGDYHQVENRFAPDNATVLYPLQEIFGSALAPGDRVIVRYQGFGNFPHAAESSKGVVLFLTETGNDTNDPNIVYRDSLEASPYFQGYGPVVVY
jgi:hypothetical protein